RERRIRVGRGASKRIEVHDDDVDQADAVLLEGGEIVGPIAPRQNAAVEGRVQRLDPAVHHLGEARDGRHIDDRQAGVDEGSRRAAGRHQLEAAPDQRAGQIDDAGLVRDAQEGPWHNQKSAVLSLRRRAGLAPKGKGRMTRPFFLFNDAAERRRQSKQEEERCVSQARSSGSTTPRATVSSSGTGAAMSSSTTRPFRVTASDRSKKARRSSSRSLTAPRARRPATSPKSEPTDSAQASLLPPPALSRPRASPPAPAHSFAPFIRLAVKFTFPSLSAIRNATSAVPDSRSFCTCPLTTSANLWNGTCASPACRRASASDS